MNDMNNPFGPNGDLPGPSPEVKKMLGALIVGAMIKAAIEGKNLNDDEAEGYGGLSENDDMASPVGEIPEFLKALLENGQAFEVGEYAPSPGEPFEMGVTSAQPTIGQGWHNGIPFVELNNIDDARRFLTTDAIEAMPPFLIDQLNDPDAPAVIIGHEKLKDTSLDEAMGEINVRIQALEAQLKDAHAEAIDIQEQFAVYDNVLDQVGPEPGTEEHTAYAENLYSRRQTLLADLDATDELINKL